MAKRFRLFSIESSEAYFAFTGEYDVFFKILASFILSYENLIRNIPGVIYCKVISSFKIFS